MEKNKITGRTCNDQSLRRDTLFAFSVQLWAASATAGKKKGE